MTFEYPEMLWLLGFSFPLLAGFLWWSWRKRAWLIAQFIQSRLSAHLTVGVSATLQKSKLLLLASAVFLSMLSLARPQWGYAWEEFRQQGLDIIVAIDTSRSMLAQDVPPSRLARAKLAALDLMRLAQHDRLGLVAFAGSAFLQAPLTLDEDAFRQSVDALDTSIIPEGGTSLAAAIDAATEALHNEVSTYKALVLFTDGEDHEAGAVEAAKKAAEHGIRIFTVGVGTANGDLIRIQTPNGKAEFLKDEDGTVVKSSLNETLLREIAGAAHGFYLHLSGPQPVEELYRRGLAPLPKSELSSRRFQHLRERYQWPLSLALAALLIEVLLPSARRRASAAATPLARATRTALDATTAPDTVPPGPSLSKNPALAPASAATRAAALLAAAGVALFPTPSHASIRSAQNAYRHGQFADSQTQYEQLLKKKPADARLQYNAGVAAYQAGEFADAAQHFSAASLDPHLDMQQQAFYNLGNSFYRLGEHQTELDKKMAMWEQSLKQYQAAVQLNSRDADAEFNRELVKKKIEQLKQQQNQNQNQKQPKPPKDKQDKPDQDQDRTPGKDKSQDPSQQKPQKPDRSPSQSDQDKKQDQARAQQDQNQPPQAPGQENKPGTASPNSQDKSAQTKTGAASRAGEMTPEQARQLLEAQKQEERPLIFAPLDKPPPPAPGKRTKTW